MGYELIKQRKYFAFISIILYRNARGEPQALNIV